MPYVIDDPGTPAPITVGGTHVTTTPVTINPLDLSFMFDTQGGLFQQLLQGGIDWFSRNSFSLGQNIGWGITSMLESWYNVWAT